MTLRRGWQQPPTSLMFLVLDLHHEIAHAARGCPPRIPTTHVLRSTLPILLQYVALLRGSRLGCRTGVVSITCHRHLR